MPIEVRCDACGRQLRVADEHAGKALRCPACNHISTAPLADTPTASDDVATPSWHMRTPEGQTYGPVQREELDRWVLEGRLAADCQLATDAAGPWQSASAVFPALRQRTPAPAPTFQPPSPFAPPSPLVNSATHYQIPHRGGLILVLGLLGFVVGCPIFSLMAWVMGSGDLREIRSGRMDPSGEGLTRAGQILGMLLAIPWILVAVIVLLVILVAAVNG